LTFRGENLFATTQSNVDEICSLSFHRIVFFVLAKELQSQ